MSQTFKNSKISWRFYFRLASVSPGSQTLEENLLLPCKCLSIQDIITTQENAIRLFSFYFFGKKARMTFRNI